MRNLSQETFTFLKELYLEDSRDFIVNRWEYLEPSSVQRLLVQYTNAGEELGIDFWRHVSDVTTHEMFSSLVMLHQGGKQ